MDIRVLRYFLAAAREENITRAAESLHIAQPSLSKQLMELEQELGKPLLIRGKRKLTLTEEGVLLRKRAEEIVALVDKTEQEIAADAQQISGEVAIGGNPQPSLMRAAALLRQQCPGVRFNFYSNDATDVTERLEHGSLDFTTLLMPVDPMRYDSLPLPEQSRWGLLVRAADPLAGQGSIGPAALLAQPLIMHRRAGLQRIIAQWAGVEPEQLPVAATYNVIHGSPVPLVQSGLGSLVTTRDLLDDELNSTVRFLPLDPPLETHTALVWKRRAVLSRAAEKYLEILRGLDKADCGGI